MAGFSPRAFETHCIFAHNEQSHFAETALIQFPKSEPRRTIEISTWEGLFANAYIVITDVPYLTAFAVMLAANNTLIALIGGLPYLTRVFQVLGAFLVERYGKRKTISIASGALTREIWIIVIAVALLFPNQNGLLLSVFGGVTFVSFVASMVLAISWMSWASDFVPSLVRAKYMGVRLSLMAMVNIATSLTMGATLDFFRPRVGEIYGYITMLGVAVVVGAITLWLFTQHHEPHFTPDPAHDFLDDFLAPIRNARFRSVLIFLLMWYSAIGVAGVFFTVQMIQVLHMSFTQIALFFMSITLGRVVFNPIWGRVLNRVGGVAALRLTASLISVNAFLWLFATPDFLLPIWIDALISGFAWTGFDLAVLHVQFSESPARGRTYYYAWCGITSGLGFFLCGLLGGAIVDAIGSYTLSFGFLTLEGNRWLFLLSLLCRLVSIAVLVRLRPDANRPPHALFADISGEALRAFHTSTMRMLKFFSSEV
ncbi:MAG: hypothetical protein HY22_09695 [[Candidatus Thermochlorobacteriaceae] bacterium GBChlB]|nr:MAG: hypothetical protein HY22_09695 [[Candidatus Thermochlorobacteriaceae] bacterium GBChlB]